jgi:amino acid transporter
MTQTTAPGREEAPHLERGLGLLQATATNIVAMVGIGPFLTIPFMIGSMEGPHLIYAWLAGAFLALCDGLVYAQLGAALPGSAGQYLYLREAYRPLGLGRYMGFMVIFMTVLVAPLSVAGGAVGFANYLQFAWTSMTPAQHHLVAAGVCVATTALLYRDIESVGRLTVAMLVVVLITVGWVIVVGLLNFSPAQAFDFPEHAYRLDGALVQRLGATAILAMYSYGGYNQVCSIGEEIRNPTRTVPRSIVLAIVIVAAIYIVMSTVIVGMLPWEEVQRTNTVASIFVQRTFADPVAGRAGGLVMTALILFVAAASLYAVILGYSRVPFAAARDGDFFRVFARVHPTKHFPHVSLLAIGLVSLPFCFFTLGQLVNWLMQVQILMSFVWQCAAVVLLRRYRKDIAQPFTMWLYPVPAVVSGALWLYIFFTGPREGVWFSIALLAGSAVAYALFVRSRAAAVVNDPERDAGRDTEAG